MMTLREIIWLDFKIDLPISGGNGNSIDNPIIIHESPGRTCVETEYLIFKCLGIGRQIEWKVIKQQLFTHNSRKFDKLKIETKEYTETEIITQIENYYFDITECFGSKKEESNSIISDKNFEA